MRSGLTQFGVNLTRLEPGAASALRHWHEQRGRVRLHPRKASCVLVEDEGEIILKAGDCAGCKANVAERPLHLVNRIEPRRAAARSRHARAERARALSGRRPEIRARRQDHPRPAQRRRRPTEAPIHSRRHANGQFQARSGRRRHRADHLGHARQVDERDRHLGRWTSSTRWSRRSPPTRRSRAR